MTVPPDVSHWNDVSYQDFRNQWFRAMEQLLLVHLMTASNYQPHGRYGCTFDWAGVEEVDIRYSHDASNLWVRVHGYYEDTVVIEGDMTPVEAAAKVYALCDAYIRDDSYRNEV